MIGEALRVQKGEVRLGKGGVPGHCGNGWGVGFASSAWELLGALPALVGNNRLHIEGLDVS